MPRFERKALVERLQDMKRRRIPIVGGGAGTGLSAKCEEEGGIDLIVIPVAEPEDAEYVLKSTRACHGFYGASSMERLPTERALREQARRFKAVSFG